MPQQGEGKCVKIDRMLYEKTNSSSNDLRAGWQWLKKVATCRNLKANFLNIHPLLRLFVLALTVWCGMWDASAETKLNYEKRIRDILKTISARKHQIEFLEFKKGLHEDCLCPCQMSHKSSARGYFDGKPYKVCHHHPAGGKHNSGVTQAISSLQRKIDALELSVELQERKLEQLKRKATEAGIELPEDITDEEEGSE